MGEREGEREGGREREREITCTKYLLEVEFAIESLDKTIPAYDMRVNRIKPLGMHS